jgi:Fe2+ or Zn2+ uptake regulation protein
MDELSLEDRLAAAEAEVVRLKHAAENNDFIKVIKDHLDEMKKLSMRSGAAHSVLTTLIQQMGNLNAVIVSMDALCKLSGLSFSTVKRAVGILREENWVTVVKIGTTAVYRVNSDLLWQDRSDGRWAAFSANIVVDFDEQDDFTKKNLGLRTRHIPLVEADDGMQNQVHTESITKTSA